VLLSYTKNESFSFYCIVKEFDSGASWEEDRYGKRNIHDKHIWKGNPSSMNIQWKT
jgi:hypothetical protein